MFPSFELFGRTIGLYGVMSITGLSIAVLFFYLHVRKKGVPFDDVIIMVLVAAAGILIGGHMLYGVTQIPNIVLVFQNLSELGFKDAISYLATCFGGSVFFGGLLGSLASGAIYLKHTKWEPEAKIALSDAYACAIPLFHTFGRIGCFLGGCCYGVESSFGFIAHGNTFVPELNDVRRFPVALCEAACNLVLFLVLWHVLKRENKQGRLIYYYGVSYSVIRFGLEFLRGDEIRGRLWIFSTSQWISVFLFMFCFIRLAIFQKMERKRDADDVVSER